MSAYDDECRRDGPARTLQPKGRVTHAYDCHAYVSPGVQNSSWFTQGLVTGVASYGVYVNRRVRVNRRQA